MESGQGGPAPNSEGSDIYSHAILKYRMQLFRVSWKKTRKVHGSHYNLKLVDPYAKV